MSVRVVSSRVVVAAVLAVVVIASAVILLGRDDYLVHARFLNADGLVEGGRVEVAGRKVGSIDRITLDRDGRALIDLSISDRTVAPLHDGTRAAIRAVGQAGLANRYVDLTPGPPGRPEIADGATLSTEQTSGIVNIDALINSFGPVQRRRFGQLMAHGAEIYAGSGARTFNDMLRRLAPASRDFAAVTHDVALDRRALTELIDTAATASAAVATRRDDVSAALDNATASFRALSADRGALEGTLSRAPAVLRQATGTLTRTRGAVTTLRPGLKAVPAAARPLGAFLSRTDALLASARYPVSRLAVELPQLNEALGELVPLERPLVRALTTTGVAMKSLLPTLRVTRLYGTDLILGVFSGLVGITTGPYDARGHYGKLNFIQSPQTTTSGPLADLLQQNPLVPGVLDVRTKLTRRCPGGLNPPAPDGSSPWDLGESLCSHEDDMPGSVNEP